MKTILIQLDTDSLPSAFDRVVAVDAGVDELFSYGTVSPENVTGLVHGAIFTRGPADLKNTAIFVGGSNVAHGEALARAVAKAFFGPMKVSVMMDSNGCNTTAAAAVACLRQHLPPSGAPAVVLGGTGPVGLRAAELLALEGADVTLVSRTIEKATAACEAVRAKVSEANITPCAASDAAGFLDVCRAQQIIVAAGAAGICFLPEGSLQALPDLKVAVDLNAVPPVGTADIGAMDKGRKMGDVMCYGALGVGGLKMKVHKRALTSLFESNDRVLQTRELFDIALQINESRASGQ
jgi:methylenetetrahydrofolate/methylenetetrahydromethanopterin dehydrogenase (NADP+)